MARTGTLSEACYHEELRASAIIGCNGATDSEQESMELDTDNTDKVLEYDKNVDEQEIIQSKMTNEATFLLGGNSRFVRSIKYDRKFFLKVFKGRKDGSKLAQLLWINDIFHFVEISCSLKQGCIQNAVKHLRWSFL